ncbi:MAG: YggS family pyridoxal phosphate-dependent enzyme [Clostridia bacterium]|nr:YggS family pyridoxal phosphate-dependent enzyme [Clostridia bacterium]
MSFENIEHNIKKILLDIGDRNTNLLAVTKTRTVDEINYAIHCGVRHIGENRVQELLEKYDSIERDGVSIHLIGQLQTNKVKYIIDKVDLIHSVDSLRLAQEISKRALAAGKIQDVLIEVNIGGEESKGGVDPDDLVPLLENISKLPAIHVRGLMCIPPIATQRHQNLKYFLKMKQFSVDITEKKIDNIDMDILSMGMSGDYEDAIEAGSTFIRVGRGIFGPRN